MNDDTFTPQVDQHVIVRWSNTGEYEVGAVIEIYGQATELRAEVRTDSGRTWRGPVGKLVDATVPDDLSSLAEGR